MPVKMLVVDDEPDLETLIRQKFRVQIRKSEYEFVFAQNGVDALAKLDDNEDVSIILSDINMPEMDGLTLLQKLHDLNKPALKAVIVSAYGDMENIRTAMNRGAFDFVMKPIDFGDLEVTIKKTLSHLDLVLQAQKVHAQFIAVQRDLNIAARIQQSILPQKFPPFPDRKEFAIYAEMLPAKEVGGDFYDFFFIDQDRLALVIGDVSGKGVPAAFLMAVSRTLLKAMAQQVANPGECLRRVNATLAAESDPSMFVTIFYGVLNTRTGELQYSNGGHNPPYILRAKGGVEPLEDIGGTLIGMMENLEFDVKRISLHAGDALFMYTDGVPEVMNNDKELFTDTRMVEALERSRNHSLEDLVRDMFEEIRQFANGAPQSDDITMLTVKYVGKK